MAQRTQSCIPYSKVRYLVAQRCWQLEERVWARGWRWSRFLRTGWCWNQAFLEALKDLTCWLPEKTRRKVTLHVPCSYVSLKVSCRLLSGQDMGLSQMYCGCFDVLTVSRFPSCHVYFSVILQAQIPDSWMAYEGS